MDNIFLEGKRGEKVEAIKIYDMMNCKKPKLYEDEIFFHKICFERLIALKMKKIATIDMQELKISNELVDGINYLQDLLDLEFEYDKITKNFSALIETLKNKECLEFGKEIVGFDGRKARVEIYDKVTNSVFIHDNQNIEDILTLISVKNLSVFIIKTYYESSYNRHLVAIQIERGEAFYNELDNEISQRKADIEKIKRAIKNIKIEPNCYTAH